MQARSDVENGDRDVAMRQKLHVDLHTALDDVLRRHGGPGCRSSHEVEVLNSIDDLWRTLVGLYGDASEILLILTPALLDTRLVAAICESAPTALRRAIRHRALYAAEPPAHPATARFINDATAAGIEVRAFPRPSTWPTAIAIGTTAVAFPRGFYDHDRGAVLVRTPGVVAITRWAFEEAWHRAAPPAVGLALSEQDRRVLECLAVGLKDELAARRLEVSVRTYRRRVTSLCMRLNASSRFQAGAKAAIHGLL